MEVHLQSNMNMELYRNTIYVSRRDFLTRDFELTVCRYINTKKLFCIDLIDFYESSDHFYLESNLSIANEKMINLLKEIINRNDSFEYDFSQRVQYKSIFSNSFTTTITQWEPKIIITTKEFLDFFLEAEIFLMRWKDKKKISSAIKQAFNEMQKQNFNDAAVFDYTTEEKDKIKLIVLKEQLTMDADEYVKSLKFPEYIT